MVDRQAGEILHDLDEQLRSPGIPAAGRPELERRVDLVHPEAGNVHPGVARNRNQRRIRAIRGHMQDHERVGVERAAIGRSAELRKFLGGCTRRPMVVADQQDVLVLVGRRAADHVHVRDPVDEARVVEGYVSTGNYDQNDDDDQHSAHDDSGPGALLPVPR